MAPSALATPLPPVSEHPQQHYDLSSPTAAATMTCRYAGKKCGNPRVVKRNGSLHNLCHYHRVRANQNQRRMELRRRIKRSHEDQCMGAMLPAYLPVPPISSFTATLLCTEPAAPPNASCLYYDALPPVASVHAYANADTHAPLMPAALPLHDHLSELFSAPMPSHYVVDMLHTSPLLYKPFEGSMSPHQPLLPAAFPMDDLDYVVASENLQFAHYSPFGSAASPHERRDVVWCDQELVLL